MQPLKNFKNWVGDKLLSYLYNTVDAREVITVTKGGLVKLGGEQISDAELFELAREVKSFRRSRLWKILTETLKDHAHRTMFTNSKNWEDMLSGKMLLYGISVEENILETIKQSAEAKN